VGVKRRRRVRIDAPSLSPLSQLPPSGGRSPRGIFIAASLGATPAQVALGDRVFHGHVGGAPCAGCHRSDAKGTPLGPDLTSGHWLCGDGTLPALTQTIITQTIINGVPHPKAYPGVMPPLGGAQLSPSEVSAVAAYVWALSHRSGC